MNLTSNQAPQFKEKKIEEPGVAQWGLKISKKTVKNLNFNGILTFFSIVNESMT